MGSSQSTQTGTQASLGQRVNTGALQFATGLDTAAQTTAQVLNGVAQLSQAAAPAMNTLRLAMANIQRAQGATFGGRRDEGFFGGDDTADPAKGLREYEASLSAQAKEDTIRRLARAMKRAGINVNADGDLDEIVQQLVAKIPHPRNGKTFTEDAKSQEKVCAVIADVLNDEFTPGVTKAADKFIDTSLGAVAVCRDVARWAHSFAAGVNTEFLAVHASVRNALRSIEVLDQVMAAVWAKIQSAVEDAHDAALGRKVDPLAEVYSRAQNERRKMEEYLKNILHVQLAPAAKELEIAMREESDQNALVQKLGLKPGTGEFADTLAMAISSLGTAASIAQRVNKALKQVGLGVKQYVDSADFADFERLLDGKIESGAVKAEDLAKFLEAVNTLRSAFADRKESNFREALDAASKTGGRRGRRGGADDDEKSTVEKRSERRETEKKVILKDFAGRMSRHYDELLAAVKAIGPKLGKEIPLTDKSDALRDALSRLRDMSSEQQGGIAQRIELALIGLYMDAEARARKEQFVSALRVVSATCASLMELEMYRSSSAFLARLKAAIDAIEKTVDYFADVIAKKYGGSGPSADDLADLGLGVEGGARGGDDLSAYLPEIARSGLSLGEAVSEFAYFYYVARIRANMEQTSKELESYGEKYIDLLGDAVASRLYTLEKERSDLLTQQLTAANRPYIFSDGGVADRAAIAAGNARGTAGWSTHNGGATVAAQVFPAGAADDAKFARAQRWVADEYDVKAKFYRALQAMDLYMKAFTVGIVKDPDSVKGIKKILDGTQVIARWFSDQTGEFIWKAFENMGSVDAAGAKAAAAVGGAVLVDNGGTNDHYYKKVAAAIIANNGAVTLGVPACGVDAGAAAGNPDKAAQAKKSVADAYEYFQALKNLVNAFARIGDIFGGRELRTQVFMSPTQIYKTLVDYLKQSALSINKGGAPIASVAVDVPNADAIPAVPAAVGGYQVYFGSVAGAVGNYAVEDRYFALIIKSMAAKVMTTLGVFDMFERTSPLFDLTPTRMIVGGGFEQEADPEAIEGAAELYFRFIRLAEFYRLFRWDGSGTDPLKIAMLPELEGVFAGFIRFMFQKAVSPDSGDYSDTELRTIVRETNAIYEHFNAKAPGRANQAALTAFVMEINRRYGVIKSKDMKSYVDMVKLVRKGEYGVVNDTNYAILPGEEDNDVDRRAPSDRYVLPGGLPTTSATPFAGRTELDLSDAAMGAANGHKKMLREFRSKIDAEFAKIQNKGQFGKTSYALLIKQAETEIRRAASKEAKLAVAFKLIQGTSVVGTDASKAFMFHETVVVGLNILNAFEAMVRQLEATVAAMNPVTIENAIMDAVWRDVTGFGARAAVGVPNNRAALITMIALRFPEYQTSPGAGTTIFDRYLWDRTIFQGRSDTPANLAVASLFTFLGSEYAGYLAAALPNAPSAYKDPGAAGLNAAQHRVVGSLRLFARLMTNYGLIMQDFAENAFDLVSSNQGLVELRFTQGSTPGVQLGFSKLRGVVESLMADVKMFMDLFRPFMSRETIDRYENRVMGNVKNNGSVFWLEENFIDPRLRGGDATDTDQKVTLDGIGRRFSQIFTDLTRKTNVSLGATVTNAALIAVGGGADAARLVAMPVPPTDNDTRYEEFGPALSALVYYNAIDTVSGLPGLQLGGAPPTGYDLEPLIRGARGAAAAPTTAAGAASERFALYSSSLGILRHRSLMFSYNQLVARYLNTFTDMAGGQKIYLNLINAFANGVASRSVTTPIGYAHPDLAVTGESFGLRGDPKGEAVLLQSLAFVLQRLLKDADTRSQIPDHVVATLTDVPLYMKETMRANLPGFVKLFDLISQKGDFIKQFFQKTQLRASRPDQLALAAIVKGAVAAAATKISVAGADRLLAVASSQEYPASSQGGSLAALENLTAAANSELVKARLVSIIDAVALGAYTLSNSCSEVLKELGDNPVYFQTGEGSIETYKMRYGKLPLMPLSLSLWYLNDVAPLTGVPGVANDPRVLPQHSLGTPMFKIAYGHRQLITRSTPVGFDQMPGVKAALDAYNGTSGKREQLDEGRYLKFVQNVVASLRFAVEARNYKTLLSSANLFSTRSLFSAEGGLRDFGPTGNTVYALHSGNVVTEQTILTVVESSNQDEEVGRIAERVGGAGASAGSGREMERIYNLIDMGIMPINFHALMRDIPLANLYNYEFTFEQMVAAMYGEPSSRYTDVTGTVAAQDALTRNAKQFLLRLLVDPYMEVSLAMYGSDNLDMGSAGFVHRIYRGDNSLGMGRPKFLSDQLGNKAQFISIYQARADYDEGGPRTGIGSSRGRADAAGPATNALRALSDLKADIAAINGRIRAAVAANGDARAANATAALAVGQVNGVAAAIAALTNAAANGPSVRTDIDTRLAADRQAILGIKGRLANLVSTMRGAAIPAPVLAAVTAIATQLDAPNSLTASFAALNAVDATWTAASAARIANANFVRDVDRILNELDAAAAAAGVAGLIDVELAGGANTVVNAAQAEQLAAQRLPNAAMANPWRPQSGPRASRISYIRAPAAGQADDAAVVEVDLPTVEAKIRLEAIGKARFDTKFVRNLFLIVNLVRILRLKLNRELTQSRNVLVSSHMAVAPGVTEYGSDPFGPNEDITSTLPNGWNRFNDRDT